MGLKRCFVGIINVFVYHFSDFEDLACTRPGGNDCSEHATCINLSDGTFTCECNSGYDDDSSDESMRPGRKCSATNHSLVMLIIAGVLGGVLLIGITIFCVHCCIVYRANAHVTKVPVPNGVTSGEHPMLDGMGLYADGKKYIYEFSSSSARNHDVEGGRRRINEYEFDNSIYEDDDEKLDVYMRQIKQSVPRNNRGSKNSASTSRGTPVTEPLRDYPNSNESMRPYIATGTEERDIYLQQRANIPEPDYYLPPRQQGQYTLPDNDRRLSSVSFIVPKATSRSIVQTGQIGEDNQS
uniref:Uncharacterized protein LOC102801477 n=1 Tax=Saccoglossus kowalevskii TaxID=10224 RepID=A0ABM0M4L0_SACKO|nr:PREDICTED: uncharacterized protein LOC102801477 [Saccoglossus kowalevskii]